MDRKPDFYLASQDSRIFEEPRRCRVVNGLRGEKDEEYLLIDVQPPVSGQKYGLGDKDIERLVVATRFRPATLFPIREWPVFVHVARVLVENVESQDLLRPSEIEVIAWAELYPDEDSARRGAV